MITMKELASKLNVSVSTVSKALNDSPEISPNTIKRIKELANLYNYKPNRIALNLKTSRTKTIGVVIPDILNPFFAKVLLGIESEAAKLGYNIITCLSNEVMQKEKDSLSLLSNGSVDGYILSVSEETQTHNTSDHFEYYINEGLPIVMFDRVVENIDCDKIIIDDYKAAKEATEFLIKKGRKKIAFFSMIDNLSVGNKRREGYLSVMNDIDDYSRQNHVLIIKKLDNAQGEIRSFLEKNQGIDGIFAADNTSGVIAINVARDMGKIVPNDISVIGFANELIANYSIPKLTTVNQHSEEIGKKALNLLINRLESNEPKLKKETVIIPTSIVEREST